jgi:CheY-like chemotaxis protein
VESDIKRILCVDDDPATLKMRRVVLEGAGHSVLTAGSGAEALQMLAAGTEVDLALLDYLMPGMNGDELAGTLRKSYPRLKLIAVSGVEQLPGDFLNAVESHVRKEQGPEVLLSTVSVVLAQTADDVGNEPSASRQTVLCVEDDQAQLQLRKLLFESAGFRVLLARYAQTAMDLFRSQHVDAVVMDYWLSGTNGTAIAEEMKRINPRIPIIMLSGFSSLPGEGVVVDAWLRKASVEPQDVVNEVQRLIVLRSGAQQTSK